MFTGIKRYFIVFLIFICSVPLFAVEEYVAKIYKEIDHIFIIKSEDELNTVLSENNHDKYYYLIENYTEKKIRRLIVNNDYDFAMAAIVIVIENNLDNEQAVEMYSVISEAYEVQREHELEEEQKTLEASFGKDTSPEDYEKYSKNSEQLEAMYAEYMELENT